MADPMRGLDSPKDRRMARLEFFFDCSSPWTYLAFSQIEGIAAEAGATLIWRPILVGGVFNAVNQGVYRARAEPEPCKAAYAAKDLQDWARVYGLTIRWPSVFPVRAVDLMRGAVVAQDWGRLPAYARHAFEAYWGEDRDVSQRDEIARIATNAGLDGHALVSRLDDPATKAALRANTEDLIARGGFGSPTMVLDETDMYFGNDRLVLVRHALMMGKTAP